MRLSTIARLLFALLTATVLCGLAAVALVGVMSVTQAERVLGPAEPSLGILERYGLALYLMTNQRRLDGPAGDPSAALELEVQAGETAAGVVARLQAASVVRDPNLLRAYLRYRGLDRGIEVGRYELSGAMSPRQIAEALQSAVPEPHRLTVPEGWRREQIADRIDAMPLAFDGQAFLAATEQRPIGHPLNLEIPDGASLEGFLFPDTYLLENTTTPQSLVRQMLDNFQAQVRPDLRRGFRARGLNLYEAVTLASIVEREAVVPEERPIIASVFLNRLALGMKLDADPTVQYALGRQPDGRWWKSPLSLSDLQVDSPYNTYLYPGLPPGPIANPGLAALEAVAMAPETPYLYFRADCDGSGRHRFAATFEEHLANACP